MRPTPITEVFKSGSDEDVRDVFITRSDQFKKESECLMMLDSIVCIRENADELICQLVKESGIEASEWLKRKFWYDNDELKDQLNGIEIDVNNRNYRGKTLLYDCATALHPDFQERHISGFNYLLERGGDINLKHVVTSIMDQDWKEDGITPLMKATSMGYDKIVRFLLEKGADINVEDNQGRTALDYAILFERSEIENILTKNK